ncbi:hypothetical protein NDU88_005373 [Pleurodeles waltl]|uniref:Uncharacterized protein n=1 Tax=Pleurodeles waltl TaxID=8319 RepID=A0AAV7VLV1_PLEWA|nr:hypothetical protein NDU88_005373 [Pleurodeles waltl]
MGLGTQEQWLNLNLLVNKYFLVKSSHVYLALINLLCAFDSVFRSKLWKFVICILNIIFCFNNKRKKWEHGSQHRRGPRSVRLRETGPGSKDRRAHVPAYRYTADSKRHRWCGALAICSSGAVKDALGRGAFPS